MEKLCVCHLSPSYSCGHRTPSQGSSPKINKSHGLSPVCWHWPWVGEGLSQPRTFLYSLNLNRKLEVKNDTRWGKFSSPNPTQKRQHQAAQCNARCAAKAGSFGSCGRLTPCHRHQHPPVGAHGHSRGEEPSY